MLFKQQCFIRLIIFRGLIVLALLCWTFSHSFAQKTTKVQIEHADQLKFGSENGKNFKKLIGNAILKQDSTYFYCDTATLDDHNNLRAVGSIHINFNDSVNLYGDFLTYFGDIRLAVVDSNVRLIDQRATLYTDHLEYDRNQAIAYYFTGGRIIDEDNVLTSKVGRYFTRTYEFLFKDSVVVVNPDYTLLSDTLKYNTETEIVYIEGPADLYGKDDHIYSEKGWYDTRLNRAELSKNNRIHHLEQILKGDWIYYDGETEYGKALGNVWVKDTVQKVILEGGVSEFFRQKKFSYMTDSARAILIDTYDSLYMHADSFILVMDSANHARTLYAYNHTKFYKKDLQGMCDSLIFRVQDSVIALLNNPVLWSDDNQLTSDSMWMYVNDNRIDSLVLYNLAFIISRDSNETYNQIKGRQMRAYFMKNQLYRIKVLGNAETIYYVRDENYELIGINKSVSSNILIKLFDRKVRQIYYLSKPEAAIYPEKDLPREEQFLRDFRWITGQRPASRHDIFIWDEKGSEN